jgi:two-component system, cell cycle response regulator DivK
MGSHPRSNPILVVDDHDLNLKLLTRVLELEGHDVIGARSLDDAHRAIEQEPPALIVLDVNLPDGDGLELARAIKSEPAMDCRVLACTGGALSDDRERALQAGCDGYVSKPIDTRDFAQLVASLLPEHPAGRGLTDRPPSPIQGSVGAGAVDQPPHAGQPPLVVSALERHILPDDLVGEDQETLLPDRLQHRLGHV